jgi:phage N-6-adenine-methyltransferase
MTENLKVHFSSQTVEWATPQLLFDDLDAEFDFELDVCATPENAKCAKFFTKDDDGLAQRWEGVCWMNPPYGRQIGRWVRKAFESAQQGATVVCLVPARTDTQWWHRYCAHGEVRLLEGRLKFGDGRNSAPFPSAIVIFRPLPKSRFRWTTTMAVPGGTPIPEGNR